ncbi:MAG: gamma-glutamyltransferase family protein [Gammaproteobacteria bacterium]
MSFFERGERGGRSSVYASNGLVATSQPLAAQAGLFILREGGNAVDAALATAIALTVVEPTSNGLGSDVFALILDGKALLGLNGSGHLPGAFNPDQCVSLPESGWLPVMTPGAPRAWADLHERLGRLPFARLFEPAIAYAQKGFPLSPVVAHFWRRAAERFQGPLFQEWQKTFMPEGFDPRPGAFWKSEDLAHTLERIARSDARDFYEGTLAHKMDQAARVGGGLLRREDLAGHRSEWVEPWSIAYRDYTVFELPPNSQGVVALEALGILDCSGRDVTPAAALHDSIEAIKLSFEDALDRVGDPGDSDRARELLESWALRERSAHLGPTPSAFVPASPFLGGTVYLASADRAGLMVSLIQSNYMGFGSGIVIPGTGIALSNRALCFGPRTKGGPNRIGPFRRSYHTLMPGFLMSDGEPLGPFGVMGGFMQPQGHLQIIQALVDQGLDPQGAVDQPRWRWDGGLRIVLEPDFPRADAEALSARGHEVIRADSVFGFGRAQIVLRHAGGGFVAGSDSRADGVAAGY